MKQTYEERRLTRLSYYDRNREAIQKKNGEWLEANREKVRRYLAHRRARRAYWLGIYKCKKGCQKCGYNKFAGALEFDHLDPKTKKAHPSWLMNSKLKVLFAELRKCRLLCSNCHREETLGNGKRGGN